MAGRVQPTGTECAPERGNAWAGRACISWRILMPARDALGRLRQLLSSPRGLLGAILCAGVAWSSWPAWRAMADRWSTDPRYAHGYLVPAFALVLLWLRRGHLAGRVSAPSWWGIPLIVAGAILQVAGGFY